MAQFRIPAVNLPRLEADIADLNKRAKRLKVEPIEFEVVGWESKMVSHPLLGPDVKIEKKWALVEIAGSTPKLEGWSFAAKIEPTEAGNLVKTMPGVEGIPDKYRTSDMRCDHCNTGRRRNEVFVVRHEDGRWAQVGRNCLADFLGHSDPERLARMAEYDQAVGQLGADAEGEGWGRVGGGAVFTEDLDTYVATVAAFIRHNGWTPRSGVEYGGVATADQAWMYLFPTSYDKDWIKDLARAGFEVTESDLDLARRAIAWAREIEPTNDYLHNVKVAASLTHVLPKTTGIIASVVNAYRREVERAEIQYARREAAKALCHIGTVGERRVFTDLKVANVHTIDTMYGAMHIFKLLDQDGNVLVWKTSTYPSWAEQGETVTVKATVNEHSFYREEPQTEIKRVALTA